LRRFLLVLFWRLSNNRLRQQHRTRPRHRCGHFPSRLRRRVVPVGAAEPEAVAAQQRLRIRGLRVFLVQQ